MIEEKPKTLNRKKYLHAEEKLSVLAKKVCLSQSELDLFLWFLKTGKVLK
jgi:N-glycosylase/DNA lyase